MLGKAFFIIEAGRPTDMATDKYARNKHAQIGRWLVERRKKIDSWFFPCAFCGLASCAYFAKDLTSHSPNDISPFVYLRTYEDICFIVTAQKHAPHFFLQGTYLCIPIYVILNLFVSFLSLMLTDLSKKKILPGTLNILQLKRLWTKGSQT